MISDVTMINGIRLKVCGITSLVDAGDLIGALSLARGGEGVASATRQRLIQRAAFAAASALAPVARGGDQLPEHEVVLLERTRSFAHGENPHQQGTFYGDLNTLFDKLHGKELSYNNLVDVDAAIALIGELPTISFAIIKHTNVCGVANRTTVFESWQAALAGDPESAFGGVLVTNGKIDTATAEAIQEIFFEVLIAPAFDTDALTILSAKKNRVLLQSKPGVTFNAVQKKSILNGNLEQGLDTGNYTQWDEAGARACSDKEKEDLIFGNIICKHLKSNAIALIKDKQLVGKGCGQTSRVDALRHAIEKAKQFKFDLKGATLASDAFFPFDDCVRIAHAEGIEAYIQPGGSVRDKDSIAYCKENGLAMVMTQLRHFKH